MQIAKHIFVFLFLTSAFAWGYRGDVISKAWNERFATEEDSASDPNEADTETAEPIARTPGSVGSEAAESSSGDHQNQGFGEIVEQINRESPLPAPPPVGAPPSSGFSVPSPQQHAPLSLDVPNYVPPENLQAPQSDPNEDSVEDDSEDDTSVDEEEDTEDTSDSDVDADDSSDEDVADEGEEDP